MSAAIAWTSWAVLAVVVAWIVVQPKLRQRREDIAARKRQEAFDAEANRRRDYELMAAMLGPAPREPQYSCKWSPEIARKHAGVV